MDGINLEGKHLIGLMLIRVPVRAVSVGRTKYADDTTIQVNISKFQPESRDIVNQYFEWSDDNCMPCNLKRCKELFLQKKCKTNCSNAQIDHITQVDSLKILGVTFQTVGSQSTYAAS